ncbi:unnamed protein product [Effrenium voratum]|uniref:Uncharacterized protein n=1 Tax=Effrenium voratum TaxID=2562239 RepID=A0AA36NDK5_9DINO|nr:unnamed protein product [Effrenium voratum]CAJ1434991.1 unnamed protein product [Effrenium voratum]
MERSMQPMARYGGRLLCIVTLAAALWLRSSAFVSFQASSRATRNQAIIPRRAGAPVANSGRKLKIMLPKVLGFQFESDKPKEQRIQPLVVLARDQRARFWEMSKKGCNVSEVFVRYEGRTPWKRVGEIVHRDGDFREAIQAQYNFLIKRSYKLYRKFRYWLPTAEPVQFGYTDTEGNIVPVSAGPLELGVEPTEMKAMINRCGFVGSEKPRYWRHMQRNVKDKYETKKDFHRKKFWLTRRKFNTRLAAHKWYDPNKYRGRYMQVQKIKRGIVSGTGPSR